ncbi:MAG TPA: heme ABC exporter ATP-binding protein CcmA [Acidimicrobiales bacterium]|jgi:heme ABC exporter ATP-binding subunit CcmA|nr:heme ABC exporter ATP-binding protein CcmA [Acidimicrobiales bacterium]
MDQVIRFRSAVALAGRFPLLAGVDLDVDRGDVVLLRGANGAGKTSLLRACCGLLRVVGGQASVLGHDLTRDQRAVRRQVGLLGHHTALYDEMTAADNLRFALRAARVDTSSAGPAMETLGLTGRLATTALGSLSAGQRRRVALAVLVARDPELWLLDEPHAGLDAEHRDLLDGLIVGAAGRGRTIVMASHEADRAVPLAGSVVTMAGGTVSSVVTGQDRLREVATGVA